MYVVYNSSNKRINNIVARKNYLNNKDILKEIHKSKTSYCSYLEPEFHQYDIILPNLERINIRTIAQAKRNQAVRLQHQAHQKCLLENPSRRVKLADFIVNWKKVEKTDLVFRIMTFDHIPLEPGRKKTPKTVADHHAKLNFPPYQHWKFDEENNLILIGKSHWIGGMGNGHYSREHGNFTNKLATMFMKLCDRYGSRGNWRGYTYNDEMRGQGLVQLTQVGLQFDENKSDNPFAYYTAIINASFTRVLNLEKRNQNIRDDILEMNDIAPSYTRQTLNEIHKTRVEGEEEHKLIIPNRKRSIIKK